MQRVLYKPSSISVLLEHAFLVMSHGAVGSVDVWCIARWCC